MNQSQYGVCVMPDGYRITRDDLIQTLDKQGVNVQEGDIVLIRTGRMHAMQTLTPIWRIRPV